MKTGAQEAHGVDGPNLKTTLDVGLRVRLGPRYVTFTFFAHYFIYIQYDVRISYAM